MRERQGQKKRTTELYHVRQSSIRILISDLALSQIVLNENNFGHWLRTNTVTVLQLPLTWPYQFLTLVMVARGRNLYQVIWFSFQHSLESQRGHSFTSLDLLPYPQSCSRNYSPMPGSTMF